MTAVERLLLKTQPRIESEFVIGQFRIPICTALEGVYAWDTRVSLLANSTGVVLSERD